MDHSITTELTGFRPISLEGLNGKAAMLERLDNKYIVPANRLRPALHAFSDLFDVLEIDGIRAFTYATRYYDDDDLRSYYDHHQGRRKRCKVRVRDYVDTGLSYLEVKLKSKRQITVKKRLKLQEPGSGLDHSGESFIDTCHREIYDSPFDRPLAPVIEMQYMRITLVAKEGGERMTIDTELSFKAGDVRRLVRPDISIVETKSARGNGIADAIFRGLHVHPTKRCSKYCVGMAATGQVERHNRFLPALRRLQLLDGRALSPA
ncbi:VTC domain-containing protein (plasmid) [Nitratireductor aquimarinus]|uniref:polyphosphate polymerase domain-containing protein n=1 Tax=Nitratireductor aquimarinus TaxID=889300 RepID=UPI003B5B66AF